MSPELMLYLIGVVNNIDMLATTVFAVTVIVCFIVCICLILKRLDCYYEEEQINFYNKLPSILHRVIKWSIPSIIITLISIFIPDEKTMYLMMGSHYLKNSTLPIKVETIIEKKLDRILLDETKGKDKHAG